MAKRDKLAEIYNDRGVFPAVIFIDQKGEVIGKTGFVTLSAHEYIKYIKKVIRIIIIFTKYFSCFFKTVYNFSFF